MIIHEEWIWQWKGLDGNGYGNGRAWMEWRDTMLQHEFTIKSLTILAKQIFESAELIAFITSPLSPVEPVYFSG
jgi:hypothetical protein